MSTTAAEASDKNPHRSNVHTPLSSAAASVNKLATKLHNRLWLTAGLASGIVASSSSCFPIDNYCIDGDYAVSSSREIDSDREPRLDDGSNINRGGSSSPATNPLCIGIYAANKGFNKDDIRRDQMEKALPKFADGAANAIGDAEPLPPDNLPPPEKFSEQHLSRINGALAAHFSGDIVPGASASWEKVISSQHNEGYEVVHFVSTDCSKWQNSLPLPAETTCAPGSSGVTLYNQNKGMNVIFANDEDGSITTDFNDSIVINGGGMTDGWLEIGYVLTKYVHLPDDQSIHYMFSPESELFYTRNWIPGQEGVSYSHLLDINNVEQVTTHQDVIKFMESARGNKRMKYSFLTDIPRGTIDCSGIKSSADLGELYTKMPRSSAEIFAAMVMAAVNHKESSTISIDEAVKNLKPAHEVFAQGNGDIFDIAVLTFDWCGRSGQACDTRFMESEDGEIYAHIQFQLPNGNYSSIFIYYGGEMYGIDDIDEPWIFSKNSKVIYDLPWEEIQKKIGK